MKTALLALLLMVDSGTARDGGTALLKPTTKRQDDRVGYGSCYQTLKACWDEPCNQLHCTWHLRDGGTTSTSELSW